ncbi:g2162 [Coccomyxa viridis]|uniref:G2162 protein n=1 Tax=Coccomyxa viridis TaxID=1274662 RepID=A0ABP1FJP8_9CHLO
MSTNELSALYLGLPEDWPVIHVTDDSSIQTAREALESADVVGIDAEWEPYTKHASASLVQIAARNETRTCIVLLDFQEVGAPACKDLLQRLFRDKAILKVGFGILMDLKAVATAIGGEGAGCVSVVQPYIDIKTLHRQLSASSAPGIGKDAGRGLSGIVEAQLGLSLDKSLQCSSWGSRPLGPEQLQYAALDAAVLLMLLDSIIAAALPGKALAAQNTERQHSTIDGEGTAPESRAQPTAASAAELQEATQLWGIRLEVGGGFRQKPQKPSKDKRPGVREQFRQDSAGSEHIGHPASIPWLGSGRPDAEPRFICDGMTEGLARQLRLCGIDARSAPLASGRQRYQAYMELASVASSEQRVVLTADTVFLRARYIDQAYWVRTTNKRDQLQEVLNAFNIEVKEGSLLSRCAKCNGTFIPRPLTKAQLPATCILSEGVRSRHDCFYMCSNEKCQKIYWQGNQYGNALQNLTARVLKQPPQLHFA